MFQFQNTTDIPLNKNQFMIPKLISQLEFIHDVILTTFFVMNSYNEK